MTISELRDFHPDGYPVGHPGLSAGLRGCANRKNRRSFTQTAKRRGSLPDCAPEFSGGILVLPLAVDPALVEPLRNRIMTRASAAETVITGQFFKGQFSWPPHAVSPVCWQSDSICLDIVGVTENELADIANDIVAFTACSAALLRHEKSGAIYLVTESRSGEGSGYLTRAGALLRRLIQREARED